VHNIRIKGQGKEIICIPKTRNILNCFENALVGGVVRKYRLTGKEENRAKLCKADLRMK